MAFNKWLSKSRRGGGEYNTQNFIVPPSVDNVRLRLDVTPSDFGTGDLSVTASVEFSNDGAQSYRPMMSVGWVGCTPPPTRPGVTPGWYATVSGITQYAGHLMRVHFSTSGDFRWGLEGEIS